MEAWGSRYAHLEMSRTYYLASFFFCSVKLFFLTVSKNSQIYFCRNNNWAKKRDLGKNLAWCSALSEKSRSFSWSSLPYSTHTSPSHHHHFFVPAYLPQNENICCLQNSAITKLSHTIYSWGQADALLLVYSLVTSFLWMLCSAHLSRSAN